MTTLSPGDAPVALGFLTVVEEPTQGLVGGYLVVNEYARPLEFHCTVPVRPNRAQEVLFGPTLQPYLYGEQIGATLVKTSALRPLAIFTDCQPALAAADHILSPLWLVMPDAATDESPRDEGASARRLDGAHGGDRQLAAGLKTVRCGASLLARGASAKVLGGCAVPDSAEARLWELAAGLDLSEPFGRIRAALQESQRGWR